MAEFKIYWETRERAEFYAGQILKGVVELHLNQPKLIKGIFLKVYGEARCLWTEERQRRVETDNSNNSGMSQTQVVTETVNVEERDVYMNLKSYLFGSEMADAINMPSGIHKFNFECPLPANLPESFEATKYGRIRYHAEAGLDLPLGHLAHYEEFKLPLIVARVDDLNESPELKFPTESEQIEHSCFFCCASEPIIMTVRLPYTGFVPGQNIDIKISYNNKSDVDIDSTKINLGRIVHCIGDRNLSKTKVEVQSIAKVTFQGCQRESSASFDASLMVPYAIPNSNKKFCEIVQISYELRVEAENAGCCADLGIIIPITIGSIALTGSNYQNGADRAISSSVNPSAPLLGGQTDDCPDYSSVMPSAPLPDLPPSFDEAMEMKPSKWNFKGTKKTQSKVGWNIPKTSQE